jgi:mono/diheme cytochrome c family protein
MTERLLTVAIALAVIALAAACKNNQSTTSGTTTNNRAAAQATPDQFASARATYEKNCKSCHGPNGTGGPVKLEDGTRLKVPTLCEGHALRHPDSDFVKQITKGGDGMPAFGEKLKPEEINECVRFIRHEFQGGMMPPGEPMKSPMKDMKMK